MKDNIIQNYNITVFNKTATHFVLSITVLYIMKNVFIANSIVFVATINHCRKHTLRSQTKLLKLKFQNINRSS